MTAPVELADAGNNCHRCHRPLAVNEPLYRGERGSVICAGCKDALSPDAWMSAHAHAANVTAFIVELSHMPTSEVLRFAAANLRVLAPLELRDRASAIAAELTARAYLMNEVAKSAPEADAIDGRAYRVELLRKIGEVR